MQVFLPYPDFAKSARCLDLKRAKNQRNELLAILRSNLGLYESGGWANHPAAKMCQGHEGILCDYAWVICGTLANRGVTSAHADYTPFAEIEAEYELNYTLPDWMGNPAFHRSHRQALLAKDWDHYVQYWFDVPKVNYVWPEGGRHGQQKSS